jgi:hypothetical protein
MATVRLGGAKLLLSRAFKIGFEPESREPGNRAYKSVEEEQSQEKCHPWLRRRRQLANAGLVDARESNASCYRRLDLRS